MTCKDIDNLIDKLIDVYYMDLDREEDLYCVFNRVYASMPMFEGSYYALQLNKKTGFKVYGLNL